MTEEELLSEDGPKRIALLLAGGVGLRAGGSVPKQFATIQGRPMLWWSMHNFVVADPRTRLILVIHPDHISRWEELMSELPVEFRFPHEVVAGGADRTSSVANGLAAIGDLGDDASEALVAIHDGARPATPVPMIHRGWEAAREHGAAVPGISLTDSIRRLEVPGDMNSPSRSEDRSAFVAVQTPQVFRLPILREAYERREPGRSYTDDASVVERIAPVYIYQGEPTNIKVTLAEDFLTAERNMQFPRAEKRGCAVGGSKIGGIPAGGSKIGGSH